jgi:uncharacterized membrane protein YdbT with pleckstrin-like domain
MWERFVRFVLGVFAVPPEPAAPFGAAGSLVVFRAAPQYFKYRLCVWALEQLAFMLAFALVVGVVELAMHKEDAPAQAFSVAHGLEFVVGAVLALAFVVGYAIQRLDYEMRWYMVTDRSLRIRDGVLRVREMTLTFANVQNVSIDQGPLQRLLGVADLRVQTAGGGAGHEGQGESMHVGVLRGIEDAERVRELVLARLRAAGGAGLGDPDDAAAAGGLEQACRALVSEASALARVAQALAVD